MTRLHLAQTLQCMITLLSHIVFLYISNAHANDLVKNRADRQMLFSGKGQAALVSQQQWLSSAQAQKKAKYVWWERRLGRAFQLYDETRIDHFRGFAGAPFLIPIIKIA